MNFGIESFGTENKDYTLGLADPVPDLPSTKAGNITYLTSENATDVRDKYLYGGSLYHPLLSLATQVRFKIFTKYTDGGTYYKVTNGPLIDLTLPENRESFTFPPVQIARETSGTFSTCIAGIYIDSNGEIDYSSSGAGYSTRPGDAGDWSGLVFNLRGEISFNCYVSDTKGELFETESYGDEIYE